MLNITDLENLGSSTSDNTYRPARPITGIALLYFTQYGLSWLWNYGGPSVGQTSNMWESEIYYIAKAIRK
jgi:hypothetical protein